MSRSAPEQANQLTEESLALIQAFKNAYRSADRRKGRESHRLGGSPVSQAQFELLIELKKQGPMAVGELAQTNGLSAASVSQMVDRLSEQGHVERVRSEEDRRVVKVELSQQGDAAINPILDRWRRNWSRALEDMPSEDLVAATRVLEKIATIYEDPVEE